MTISKELQAYYTHSQQPEVGSMLQLLSLKLDDLTSHV